jgi:hypothetical protein
MPLGWEEKTKPTASRTAHADTNPHNAGNNENPSPERCIAANSAAVDFRFSIPIFSQNTAHTIDNVALSMCKR